MRRAAIGKLAAVVGVLSSPACSQAGEPVRVERVSACDMSKEHAIPTTASEMLSRLASALRNGRFLQSESFSPAALACVFGSYAFTSLPKSPPALDLAFEDAVLASPLRPQYTGLRSGYLFLRYPEPDLPRFNITALVRAVDERFTVERVIQIFGTPSEVDDWVSYGPSLHGQTEPPRKRDGLKNARVLFEFKATGHWSRISFQTSEYGIVTGFEATGGRRQD